MSRVSEKPSVISRQSIEMALGAGGVLVARKQLVGKREKGQYRRGQSGP